MSTINIERMGEGSMLLIRVHPTELIPLRKHIGKMVNDEIMREARAMDAQGDVRADKIAEKFHCSVQHVYYLFKKNGYKTKKTTTFFYGKKG